MKRTEVITHIYADGACRGNPGRGGWGVLLQAGTAEKELWGGEGIAGKRFHVGGKE